MIFRYILVSLLLLPGAALQAGVADSYGLETAPPRGVASKVAVDMILHGVTPTGVWLATGHGVNVTYDDGASWFLFGPSNGLPSENVSALYSQQGRLWAATSHEDLLDGQLYTISDGLSYSDDGGETWQTLDFSEDGLNIARVIGGDRTVYDITGHHDINFFNSGSSTVLTEWMFAAAFAGGLLASQDGGISWRRIFPTRSDSAQFQASDEPPSLRNRYFSCVADTSHGDSLFLWAGTASGIFQYVFATPRDKLYSRVVNSVALCDDCGDDGVGRLFLGGQSCVTTADLTDSTWGRVSSRFESDGLPGPSITSAFSLGDYFLVGTKDAGSEVSTGLALSEDQGDTYAAVTVPGTTGAGHDIAGFAFFKDHLFMAAQQGGLMVSVDSGQNWTQVPLDTLFTSPALQAVNAVNFLDDTLYLGTDSGLVELTMDAGGVITAATHYPFVDNDSLGARIIRVRPQEYTDSLGSPVTVLWTVNRPLTDDGIPMVGRRALSESGTEYVWTSLRRNTRTNDVNFFGDTAFTVGDLGIWFTTRGQDPTNHFSARQYVNDTIVVASLDSDTITAMEVYGDTVVFACSNGYAVSRDRGESFRISRANFDTLGADLVVNHTYLSSLGELLGDFVPALAVQYQDAGPARIWAGCRPVTYGEIGLSVGIFDETSGALEWQPVYENDFAWNFEFNGDAVYAATNGGLLYNEGTLDDVDTQWDTVSFVSDDGETLIAPGTSAYGVLLDDPYLWVGTDDGIIRLLAADRSDPVLFQRVDSTSAGDEVYAFPVPFSPQRGQEVDFHFVVEEAGYVTLEVYDFAMNLVARPIDNVYYAAGIYPGGGHQGVTWNGLNGKGEEIAVGVYYFRVDLPSGDSRWGKLAVIP